MMEQKLNLEIEVSSLIAERTRYSDMVKTKKWEYAQIKSLVDKSTQTLDALNEKSKSIINEIAKKKLEFDQMMAVKEEELKEKERQADEVIEQGKILAQNEQRLVEKDRLLNEKELILAENLNKLKAEKELILAEKQDIEKQKQDNKDLKIKLEKDFEDKLKKAKQAFINNL